MKEAPFEIKLFIILLFKVRVLFGVIWILMSYSTNQLIVTHGFFWPMPVPNLSETKAITLEKYIKPPI